MQKQVALFQLKQLEYKRMKIVKVSSVTLHWTKAGVLHGGYWSNGWTHRKAGGYGYCKKSTITAYWLDDVLGDEINSAENWAKIADCYGVYRYGDKRAVFAKGVGVDSHIKVVERLGYTLESIYCDKMDTVGYILLKVEK